MKLINIILILGIFILGWVANVSFSQSNLYYQFPYSYGYTQDKSSPSDWIPKENIHVYSDRVIIELDDPEWAEFEDTKSMDPILDSSANSIELKPKSTDNLRIGDIISYKSEFFENLIVHRIVSISKDNEGWFCITKGDNNPTEDPQKVRFEQIHGVLVAILY